MSNEAQRGVVVVGPPRSGTSATTRLLHFAGLRLCVARDRVGGGRNNPTGHWESKTVLAHNNRLLESRDTRWWCPPPLDDPIDGADEADEAATEFRAVHPAVPWLCKDPRFAVTLPFWRRALGDRIVAVVVLRRPDEVVASLRRTWPLSVDHAAALWARYVHGAFAVTRELPVVVVRFPELLDDVLPGLEALRIALELAGVTLGSVPLGEWSEFVRRPAGIASASPELPAHAWALWDSLATINDGATVELVYDGAVEHVLAPLRDDLRAGRPLDIRPVYATAGNSSG